MPIWRTTLEQIYATPGGPGYSTLHFRHDGIESDLVADLNTAQSVYLEALSAMVPFMPPSTTWRTTGLWQDVDGTQEVTTGRATIAGTVGSASLLPGNVCIVLGWRTADRSRRGRGRTFLSGFSTSATQDGTPSGDLLNAANEAVDEIAEWNAGFANGAWQVYSPTDGLGRDITGGQVRDVFGSLRSRRD